MNRSAIDVLHGRLLELHKLLLDLTRADYEREIGPIANAGAYLQLVIDHERFAWLRPFSMLLVELDDPKETPDEAAARQKVERLMSSNVPSFHTRFAEVVAVDAKASLAHAEVLRVLKSLPASSHVTA